jgi:putative FmdB family regulatory protein
MPLYDIKCLDCGNTAEIFLKLAEYQNLPVCECGAMFTRVISPVNVMADIKPYKSMVDGSMITSRSQHRQHLKRHGCIEIGNENPITKPAPVDDRKELDSLKCEMHQQYDQRIRHGERPILPERKINLNETVII